MQQLSGEDGGGRNESHRYMYQLLSKNDNQLCRAAKHNPSLMQMHVPDFDHKNCLWKLQAFILSERRN